MRCTMRPAPCRSMRCPSGRRKIGPSVRSPTARSMARAVRGAKRDGDHLPPLRSTVRSAMAKLAAGASMSAKMRPSSQTTGKRKATAHDRQPRPAARLGHDRRRRPPRAEHRVPGMLVNRPAFLATVQRAAQRKHYAAVPARTRTTPADVDDGDGVATRPLSTRSYPQADRPVGRGRHRPFAKIDRRSAGPGGNQESIAVASIAKRVRNGQLVTLVRALPRPRRHATGHGVRPQDIDAEPS